MQGVALLGNSRLHYFIGITAALLVALLVAQTNIQTWRPGKPLLRTRKTVPLT
jgi:hypothetical protein